MTSEKALKISVQKTHYRQNNKFLKNFAQPFFFLEHPIDIVVLIVINADAIVGPNVPLDTL